MLKYFRSLSLIIYLENQVVEKKIRFSLFYSVTQFHITVLICHQRKKNLNKSNSLKKKRKKK